MRMNYVGGLDMAKKDKSEKNEARGSVIRDSVDDILLELSKKEVGSVTNSPVDFTFTEIVDTSADVCSEKSKLGTSNSMPVEEPQQSISDSMPVEEPQQSTFTRNIVCPVSECVHANNCEIIRILGKAPPMGKKCSYFDKPGQQRKMLGSLE